MHLICWSSRSISFFSSWLIAIDKLPGVCPIGVREVAGSSQLCAGQAGCCEAAVRAVWNLFQSPDYDAVLLVDATNSFNLLNRQNALQNILLICPALATIAVNCYHQDVPLFVGGGEILSSKATKEGGSPCYGNIYYWNLSSHPSAWQLLSRSVLVCRWCAAAACGSLPSLCDWWNEPCTVGPSFGYYPSASKSWLILKSEFVDLVFSVQAELYYWGSQIFGKYNCLWGLYLHVHSGKGVWVDCPAWSIDFSCSNTASCSLFSLHTWPI